jgi:hypothetical protein
MSELPMPSSEGELDIRHPPASRPTWSALVFFIAAAVAVTLLVQWPSISAFFGKAAS